MKARITAGLTALAMLGSAMPMAGIQEMGNLIVQAEDEIEYEGTCGENLTWVYDTETSTLTISGTGSMGLGMGAKAPWRSFNGAQNVIIEDGVTDIGYEAFSYFSSMESITIPDSVTTIGENAFIYCYRLKTIRLPDSVTNIDSCAFAMCQNLEEITLPNTLKAVGVNAFKDCNKLKEITIPGSVTGYWNAFANMQGLTSVTIQDGVTTIGRSAFVGCVNLSSVTIPDSVTTVESAAFLGCKSLKDFTFPETVTSIGYDIFLVDSETSPALKSVTIMNPDCEIHLFSLEYGDFAALDWSGTIYGYEGSTAQTYAEENGYRFALIGSEPAVEMGDINEDNTVNASDAAKILIAAAAAGAGGDYGLTDAQMAAADINKDGEVNASDAALILIYAAYVGAEENPASLEEFLKTM